MTTTTFTARALARGAAHTRPVTLEQRAGRQLAAQAGVGYGLALMVLLPTVPPPHPERRFAFGPLR